MATNICYFFRFLRAAKRPATRPATPSASISMLEGSGTGVPPDEEPPDDELADMLIGEVLGGFLTPKLDDAHPELPQPETCQPPELLQLLPSLSLWVCQVACAGDAVTQLIAARPLNVANLGKFMGKPRGVGQKLK